MRSIKPLLLLACVFSGGFYCGASVQRAYELDGAHNAAAVEFRDNQRLGQPLPLR